MNKLPKVYANPINKNINNEQKCFRSDRSISRGVSVKEIDDLISSNRYIFRFRVRINGKEKVIIKRVNDYLLTIENEKININDIKRFEVI